MPLMPVGRGANVGLADREGQIASLKKLMLERRRTDRSGHRRPTGRQDHPMQLAHEKAGARRKVAD